MKDVPSGERDDKFEEFLIAEHEQLSEAFLRNEEDGEKRVTVLVTLAGGLGAVGAFLQGDPRSLGQIGGDLFVFGLAALLVLGYVTYIRVINRNVTADSYVDGLNRVRRYFLERTKTPRAIEYLPFVPPKKPKTRKWNPRSIGKGGWLEMVVMVNALIVFALIASVPVVLSVRGNRESSFAAGGIAAIATWFILIYLANQRYERMRESDFRKRAEAES